MLFLLKNTSEVINLTQGRVIALGSIKGGVGKSTICCNLAVIFQKRGVRTIIVDGDTIRSTTNFANDRLERDGAEPLSLITVKPGRQMLKTIRELRDAYPYVLVDLAGVSTEDNAMVLGMADVVISPFQPSNLDLNTLSELDELLKKFQEVRPELQVKYVLNAMPHNIPKELKNCREYFSALDLRPINAVTYRRKAWPDTMAIGLGVVEYSDEKAASEMEAVFDEIFPELRVYEQVHHA